MRSGGRLGGQGGPVQRGVWILLSAMTAVAVWNTMPHEPKAFVDELAAKSERFSVNVKAWVKDIGLTDDGSEPDIKVPAPGPIRPGAGSSGSGSSGGGTGATGTGRSSSGSVTLDSLKVVNGASVNYDRDEWRHWDNLTSCWTVREQVLYRDAVPGSANLRDRNGTKTTDVKKACEIIGGTWRDPYTNTTFTNPADLDIDHMVALGAAARSGGQAWSGDRKRDYANDLSNPTHLLAVSASANRSKGDKTPDAWKPANKAFSCSYARAWIGVKKNYSLTVTSAEKKALAGLLGTC